jgi:hypothetical protein
VLTTLRSRCPTRVFLTSVASTVKLLVSIFETGEHAMARKVADCRDFPSEAGCTLTIAGTESEVLDAALHHAITVHGHEDTPEVRDWLRENLKDEVPA